MKFLYHALPIALLPVLLAGWAFEVIASAFNSGRMQGDEWLDDIMHAGEDDDDHLADR